MPSTPDGDLLEQYKDHMDRVAGLTEGTRDDRVRHAREFLRWRFGRRKIQLQRLRPGDLSGFLLHRAPDLRPGSIRALATGLRSFARFLHFAGQGDERLAGAVTCPPPWPRSPVPDTLSETELRVFLRSFDRTTPIGRRDFAMAVFLCRLGLRAQEVASLRLEDVNWSSRTVHLRDTKTRRARVLPLPQDLARAVKAYVQQGRPFTQSKGLFVRHLAPIREARGSSLVLRAMRRAFSRSGLNCTRVHLL
ncbi:MAG: tyrosine-type recombinase/integrase, partial [Limisphaerales bacterium]